MGSIAEMKEEGDEVYELEKKTASILCYNEHSSKESVTKTRSSSSSSSSSADVTDCVFSDEANEHIINSKHESVYFDGDQGIWKCHHCDWTFKEESLFCFDHQGSESSGATDAIESQTEEILSEENKQPSEIEETKEEEEEEEEIEGDEEDYEVVEKILENQETHDLYCPNCNSCITERVLLKRRKRKIPIPRVLKDSKRLRGSYFGNETLHSDDNLAVLDAHGNSTVREASMWQCLSCFSIFIPKGPKVVPSSKDEEEIKNLPKPLKNATAKSNWFSFKWKRTVPDQGTKTLSTPQINLQTPLETTTEPLKTTLVINETPAEENKEASSSEQPLKLQEAPLPQVNQLTDKGCLSPIKPSLDANSLSKVSVEVTEVVSSSANGDTERTVTSVITTAMEPNEIRVDITQNSSLEVTPSSGKECKLDILKSIVYGGLIESITCLGVISSAAGSGASTLNILVLGLANLVGGLILIVHNLLELKEENPLRTTTNDENKNNEQETRYTKLLGRRENYRRHEIVAILSFIIFGLIPPLVYCFTFNKTDKREYKSASVLVSSLLSIGLLAIGKAHVKRPRDSYLKSVFYYVTIAISVSGISYVVGEFLTRLIEKYGWPQGFETPVEMMMLGRKGGFGFSSYSM